MKSPRRFAALACAALGVAAFGAAAWLDHVGEIHPGPLDIVWIEAATRPAADSPAPNPDSLGLAQGDRLRLVRHKGEAWTSRTLFPASPTNDAESSLPSLQSLYDDVLPGAQMIWFCRADRDLAELPARPRGAALTFSSQGVPAPAGWEFTELSASRSPRAGRPFSIQWKVASVGGGGGKLRVWFDGESMGEKSFSFDRAGEASLTITAAKAGTHTLRLEALEGSAPGRPREITSSIQVGEVPKLRVLGEENDVARWLQTQGFTQEKAAAAEQAPDLLLLTRDLTAEEIPRVEAWVRAGSGLVIFSSELGTPSALPVWVPGRVRAAPPAAMPSASPGAANEKTPAPTTPALPTEDITAPRRETRESSVLALMLVLDKSGSMAGEKLDRTIEAAIETARTLDPKDLLGIIVFDREPKELLPLGPVSQSGDLRKRFEALDAGGGTRIFPALKRGAAILEAAPASIRHLIVLTDGATEDKVAKDAPYFEFMAEQARKGLTLTAVGIRGGDYDAEFLSNLAVWGKGRFYPVDSDRIPQIFTLEAKRVRSGMSTPSQPPIDPTRELRVRANDPHPAVQGIDWEKPQDAPPLRGMLEMQPQPWASVPLLGGGSPLLATAHLGAGNIALWASAGSGLAVADWMNDARARQFWTQLAEYLRRREADEGSLAPLSSTGLDLEHRLRNPEESLREVAAMSVRCGGEMLSDVGDLRARLQRKPLRASSDLLPALALLGAALALLALWIPKRLETTS